MNAPKNLVVIDAENAALNYAAPNPQKRGLILRPSPETSDAALEKLRIACLEKHSPQVLECHFPDARTGALNSLR
jgi:hypothetical protein